MSFFTMVTFAVFVIIMVSSGVIESQETQSQCNDSAPPTSEEETLSSSHVSSSHVSSSYMPPCTLLYAPTDVPQPYTP